MPKPECRINDQMTKCPNDGCDTASFTWSFEHSGIDSEFGVRHWVLWPHLFTFAPAPVSISALLQISWPSDR